MVGSSGNAILEPAPIFLLAGEASDRLVKNPGNGIKGGPARPLGRPPPAAALLPIHRQVAPT